jgi:hypothetical protein
VPAVSLPGATPPRIPRPAIRRSSWLPAALGILAFVGVAAALLGFGRPPTDQGVAALTDAPTLVTGLATAPIVAPGSSVGAGTPPATEDPNATPNPAPTERPGGGPGNGPGATPGPEPTDPNATPRPTKPPATPPPTIPPTPVPTPTPAPTPTPEGRCAVPTLIGETAAEAPGIWAAAGFTGPVTEDPDMNPNQRIGFQSLAPGSSEPCSSGITVGKVT